MASNKPFNFYDDKIASNYENQRKNDSWWSWEDEKLSDFLGRIKENEYLLDAPSGTGRILKLFPHNEGIIKSIKFHSFLLDGALSMITESVHKKSDKNKNHFICADLEKIPLKKEVVDYTTCFRLLHLLNDTQVELILKNLFSCTKGRILLQVFNLEYDKIHLVIQNSKAKIKTSSNFLLKISNLLISIFQYIFYVFRINQGLRPVRNFLRKRDFNPNYLDTTFNHKFTFIEGIINRNNFRIVRVDKFIKSNLSFSPIYVTSILWIERIKN